MKRELLTAALITLAVSAGIVWFFDQPARAVEENAQAAVVRFVGLAPLNPAVVLIGRDDRWRDERAAPVSRKLLARMTRALHAAGARAVLFDAVMTTSAFDGPEADAMFATALRDTHGILPVACEDKQATTTTDLRPWTVAAGSLAPWSCRKPLLPLPQLMESVPLGNITVLPSASNIFREVTLLASIPAAEAMPAMAIIAMLPADKRFPPAVAVTAGGLKVGDMLVPTTADATRIVSARKPADVISLVDVEAELAPDRTEFSTAEMKARFKDRIVLYGVTAEEARDIGRMISGDDRPLVEVHAALLSDLIEGRNVREVSWPVATGLTLAMGLLLAMAGLLLRPVVSVLALLMFLLAWFGATTSACRSDVLLQPVAPAVSSALGLAIGGFRRLRRQEREQSLLRAAFGDYVDPLLLKELLERPAQHLALSGQRKEVTVLFVDLVGYTRLTNALPAEASLQILREHVQRVTTIIKAAGGRIDKIIGDGVMAVFNDPIPLEQHARIAVRVAKEIHAAVAAAKSTPALQCRIGIATGDAFVGNIGAQGAKIEYTVIGATVNLAARLEGQAPVGGTLISEATFILCAGDADFMPAEVIQLKGFDEPVRAHRSVPKAAPAIAR